jgi:hypothetical protein
VHRGRREAEHLFISADVVGGAEGLIEFPFIDRSAATPGLVTRHIEGLSWEQDLVIVTALGSTTPVEIGKIAQLASRYEWQ